MYFGLQTGWISMMFLQSSLLGYAALELLPSFLISTSLTVAGNVSYYKLPPQHCARYFQEYAQDVKAHVIQKYTSDEARNLKAYGELPENGQIDETDTFGPGEDAEFNFKSRRSLIPFSLSLFTHCRTPEDLVIPDM
ncbi:hypothetical protein MJO28_008799 [Puccinia striiformis f. sp. tritici]|uniref:Uncharacterized protein n=1 Tax=Puccinia striiformis f. sp. tritici TaxID=168172 RepID=A0ACC0EC27_9BASI|nr:hypothetical protein MJO28_008799 [Puccinia striiformis f. sp. tritici]